MTVVLGGLPCPECGDESRLIDRLPRSGIYPEMLTLKCVACGGLFTTPGDGDPRVANVPSWWTDLPHSARPVASRRLDQGFKAA